MFIFDGANEECDGNLSAALTLQYTYNFNWKCELTMSNNSL